MGSGKSKPDFRAPKWAPKWSLEVSHGQDLAFVNEWLTQNGFKIVFEGLMNEAGG